MTFRQSPNALIPLVENPAFKVSDVSVSPYPVDPSKPPDVVEFTYTILNGHTYESFYADLKVKWFGQPLLGKCDWHEINVPLYESSKPVFARL